MNSHTIVRGARRLREMPRSGIRQVLEHATRTDLVSLAAGDPDFDTPSHITAAAAAALAQGQTHYTHGRGLVELRQAWAAKMLRENGLAYLDPDTDIVVTAGALNALAATLLSIVEPGDGVLVPDPGFANYVAQVMLAGGRSIPVSHPAEADFVPDLDQLADAAHDARVLVVNTPGNPTGAVLPRAVLQQIAEIATQHDLLVVADEAYEHLVYGGTEHVSIATLPGMADRTLTISSMSKSWAMTGWRIGFVCGPADLLELIAKAQEHLIGCPPAMTQWAALAALTGPPDARDAMVARYAARRMLLLDALQGLPAIELAPPGGAFYAFPRFDTGTTGFALAEQAVAEAGVLTVPGVAFGAQGARHLRLSYACREDTLICALDRLANWLRR